MSDEDLERQIFEAWGKDVRIDKERWVRGDKAGQYKNPVVEKMWSAWLARSKEAS